MSADVQDGDPVVSHDTTTAEDWNDTHPWPAQSSEEEPARDRGPGRVRWQDQSPVRHVVSTPSDIDESDGRGPNLTRDRWRSQSATYHNPSRRFDYASQESVAMPMSRPQEYGGYPLDQHAGQFVSFGSERQSYFTERPYENESRRWVHIQPRSRTPSPHISRRSTRDRDYFDQNNEPFRSRSQHSRRHSREYPIGHHRAPPVVVEERRHGRHNVRILESEPDFGVRDRNRPKSRYSSSSSSASSDENVVIIRDPSYARSHYSDSDNDYSTDSDDFTTTNVYEFNPSRMARNLSPDPSLAPSGSDGDRTQSGLEKTSPGQSQDNVASNIVRNLRVYQSEYVGDAFTDGFHQAKLTTIHDPKRKREPLFRWIHIKQSNLNFDALSDETKRLPGLNDSERRGVLKLLSEVKNSSIKSTPTAKGTNIKYMEPRFIEISLPSDQRPRGQFLGSGTAIWLCIPYFALRKYAWPQSQTDAIFPTRTLLQAQYSGVGRERDLLQAVCQSGHVPPETCFHIEQLWCIVLDNSLLITCGTDAAEAAVNCELFDIKDEPPRDLAVKGTSAMLYVCFTEAVLWTFQIEECSTWFAFLSHFHDFWPRTLNFFHRERRIFAEDWPRVLNLAKHSGSKTTIHLRIGSSPQPPPKGVLKTYAKKPSNLDNNEQTPGLRPPKDEKRQASTPSAEPETSPTEHYNDKFHVFSWLETVRTPQDPNSQAQAESMRSQLQEIEDFLLTSTSFSDRRAYQECQEATRLSSLEYLQQLERTEIFKQQMKVDYENRIDLFNAADIVYRFFLPLAFNGPTVAKYWGAISLLIQMPSREKGREHDRRRGQRRSDATQMSVPQIRNVLRRLSQIIQSFRNILSHAQPVERATINVPEELIRAWIHILMLLIYSTQNYITIHEHADVARGLIKRGMAEVMESISNEPLLKKAAILPLEIVSLLNLKLLQDSTGANPNIGVTYSEYIDRLGNEIATKPGLGQRSFQHRISLLKQEIDIVQRTVTAQALVFASLLQGRYRMPTTTRAYKDDDWRFGPGKKQSPDFDERAQIRNRGQWQPERTSGSRQHAHQSGSHSHHHIRTVSRAHDWDDDMDVDEWTLAPDEFYKLAPTHPGGFRDLLAGECMALLDKRTREFEGFKLHAKDLEEASMNKFEDTKNQQELAIYAFTIVTVIFLPLSFVAGIFGMNTSDIRDMDLSQWAYWATAVPLTIAVILGGLWWLGELGSVPSWLGLKRGGSAGMGGRGGGSRFDLFGRNHASDRYLVVPPYATASPDGPWVRAGDQPVLVSGTDASRIRMQGIEPRRRATVSRHASRSRTIITSRGRSRDRTRSRHRY